MSGDRFEVTEGRKKLVAVSEFARAEAKNSFDGSPSESASEDVVGTCKDKRVKADAENSRAAKGRGGIETPPSVRKDRSKNGKGGKSGPKRPHG